MSNETVKLSIIVPVYNVEKYLPQCIESILSQTYKNIELILVDDGSTDSCPSICDQYKEKDSRVTVIHKENGGQGSARNCGINICKGDYIAFVDSDDYVDVNMYKDMIEHIVNTGSDMAVCGMCAHSGLRDVYSVTPKTVLLWNSAEEIVRDYLLTPYVMSTPWNKVYNRKMFKTIRFPEGVAREDVYIMHHLIGMADKGVHVGKCYYHYNIRSGSSEHSGFNPKQLISIQIADDRRDYVAERFPSLLPFAEDKSYRSRISAIRKIVRSHKTKEYKEEYRGLKQYLKEHEPPTMKSRIRRFEILYLPWLFRIRQDFKNSWRQKIKSLVLKIARKKTT